MRRLYVNVNLNVQTAYDTIAVANDCKLINVKTLILIKPRYNELRKHIEEERLNMKGGNVNLIEN